MNQTFCILPWVHLCITSTGKVTPCCRFGHQRPNINMDTLADDGLKVMDSDGYISIRKAMLEGKEVPGCHKCYIDEQAGLETYRMDSNELYKGLYDEDSFDEKFKDLRYLELSLDNVCNLQCRMCDSHHSTKLIQRDRELGKTWKSYRSPDSNILETDYSYLAKEDLTKLLFIKLLGGEPFMTPNFIRFVDFLTTKTDLKNVTLMVSTNGTHKLNSDLRERLSRFKNVIATISLDSFDKCNDYQRYGSNYKEIWDNAWDYRNSIPDSMITFHCTITVYTANKLDVTFNAFEEFNTDYTFDFVRYQEMSLDSCPDDYADWLSTKNCLNQKAKTSVTEVLRNRKFDAERWDMFLRISKRLDNFYGVSMGDYNPDLYEFLKTSYGYDKI